MTKKRKPSLTRAERIAMIEALIAKIVASTAPKPKVTA